MICGRVEIMKANIILVSSLLSILTVSGIASADPVATHINAAPVHHAATSKPQKVLVCTVRNLVQESGAQVKMCEWK